MKKISVLIPVYNHETKLPKFLKSLEIQDYKNIEYIAVDDGSKDKSLKILNEYAKKHNNFKVVYQDNQGVTGAKKTAMKYADGEYLAVLESDDYIEPSYFTNLVNQMEMTETNTCNPRYAVQIESSIPLISHLTFYSSKQPTSGFDLLENKEILTKINVTHVKLYKREYLRFTDTPFVINEDLCMTYINAARARKVSFANNAVYHYQQTKTGLVNKELSGYGIRKIKNFVFPLEELKKNFEKEQLLETYSDEVEAIFIKNFMEHLTNLMFRLKISDEKYDMISILVSVLTQYYPNWHNNKYFMDQFKGIELTDYYRVKAFNAYQSLFGIDVVDKPVSKLLSDYEEISHIYTKKYKKD